MESFSTPSRPLVPVAANACTLLVLVVATWWSGAQRPAADHLGGSQSKANSVPAMTNHGGARVGDPAAVSAAGLPRAASWQPTLNADTKTADATTLQPVGFATHGTKTTR